MASSGFFNPGNIAHFLAAMMMRMQACGVKVIIAFYNHQVMFGY
jgi:hypothetical protein